MKTPSNLLYAIAICSALGFGACNNEPKTKQTDQQKNAANLSADTSLTVLTKRVLTLLKNKDYQNLASYVHPKLGIVFSPYASIDSAKVVHFTAENFLEKVKSTDIITWGNYDGSGEPISMTANEYFKEFVYSADYLNADTTSVNKSIASGTSTNNITSVFKNCNYTESYLKGTNKKLENMDWSSLYLVFERYNEKNYLVAITHNQWTN